MKRSTVYFLFLFTAALLSASHFAYGNLKDPATEADFLVITPSCYQETIVPFIEYKNSRGLHTISVPLDSINKHFPIGNQPEAIREFIFYAVKNWAVQPQYALLVGSINHIPSFQLQKDTLLVAMDEMFVLDETEKSPAHKIALGRFPARTQDGLKNMIDKTIQYESMIYDSTMPHTFLFLADYDPTNRDFCFQDQVANFVKDVMPEYLTDVQMNLSSQDVIWIKNKNIVYSLNKGIPFFSYYGHGNSFFWSNAHVMIPEQILALFKESSPFIFAAAACNQTFNHPDRASVVETFLSLEKRGAVAVVGSSYYQMASSGEMFLKLFYQFLFENPQCRIGDAFIAAKQKKAWQDYSKYYTLLGDPTLKNPVPVLASTESESMTLAEMVTPGSFALLHNYPNPFNNSTRIPLELSETKHVTLKVYDVLGREICTLIDGELPSGIHQIFWNGDNAAGMPVTSGIYVYHLEAGDFTGRGKMVVAR